MKVLVYLKTLSRFGMAKDRSGKFQNVRVKVGADFFSGLLYKGRPLTMEEFNEEFQSVMYPRNRKVYGGAQVLVKIVDEEELSEESFDLEDEAEKPPQEQEPTKSESVEPTESDKVSDLADPFTAQGEERVRGILEGLSKGEIAEKVYAEKGVTVSTNKNKSAVIDEAVGLYFPSSDEGGYDE